MPRRDGQTSAAARAAYHRVYGRAPELELETPSSVLALGLGPGVQVGSDPTRRVTVLLAGDALLPDCASARAIADRYLRMGEGFARDLNGTYAAVLVDRVLDRVRVVTDRLGSMRVFHGITLAGHWIGCDLSMLPTDRFRVDPAAVGWYLAVGSMPAGDTPFRGVRALPEACLHELTGAGVRSVEYWDRSAPARVGPFSDRDMEEELRRRLVGAVHRAAPSDPSVFVSMSGGRGSAAVAGLLAGEQVSGRVRAFSYVRGRPAPGSDAFVAAKRARHLGLEHVTYQAYRGAMLTHVRRNAAWGLGTVGPADEAHAWEALRRDAAEANDPILLVGDHLMGPRRAGRTAAAGSSRRAGLPLERLRWLAPYVPAETYAALTDSMTLRDEAPDDSAPARAEKRIESPFSGQVAPWRRLFPGRFMSVRWPLLDYELLDWSSLLTERQRSAGLYERTLRRMLPLAFEVGLTHDDGPALDLREESRSQAARLRTATAGSNSRLDEVLPDDLVARLTELVARDGRGNGGLGRRIGRELRPVGAAVRRIARRDRSWRGRDRRSGLRNYLVLREALR